MAYNNRISAVLLLALLLITVANPSAHDLTLRGLSVTGRLCCTSTENCPDQGVSGITIQLLLGRAGSPGPQNSWRDSLKQHNGELKGGAKASRAGRPWICACLIQGFRNRSKACEFESKWKSCSTKLPRKRNSKNQEQEDNSQLLLLQHRFAALNQVKDLIDCSHLEIDWRIDPM